MPKTSRTSGGWRAALVVLLTSWSLGAIADEEALKHWPQFRGPAGSGIAAGDGKAPVEFGLERNLLCKTALPRGHSSPVVWNGKVFLTAHDPERQRLETLCLDRQTGRVLWRQPAPHVPIEKVHELNSAATPTPVSDGRSVFVYFGSYGLIAYDFEGRERWNKPLPMARTFRDFGSAASPILAGDRLIVDLPLGDDSHLLAVRSADGTTVWKSPQPAFDDAWTTPSSWREGGTTVVGVLKAGRFGVHDANDGSARWQVDGLPTHACATPVVGGGLLFVTGTGGQGESENLRPPPPFDELIARYDQNGDGRIGLDELPDSLLHTDRQASGGEGNRTLREAFVRFFDARSAYDRAEWEEKVRALDEFSRSRRMESAVIALRQGGTGDVSRSHVEWREPRGVPEVPSPLVYRDRLYIVKNGGIVISREAATGKRVFEGRLGAGGGYYASPVAADGRIYVASDVGVVTVLEAADTLKVLARTDLEEAILATPAIAGGNLYVRTARHLYAFGERSRSGGDGTPSERRKRP